MNCYNLIAINGYQWRNGGVQTVLTDIALNHSKLKK